MKKECAPSEEELKKKAAITPEDVLSLSGPTNSGLMSSGRGPVFS